MSNESNRCNRDRSSSRRRHFGVGMRTSRSRSGSRKRVRRNESAASASGSSRRPNFGPPGNLGHGGRGRGRGRAPNAFILYYMDLYKERTQNNPNYSLADADLPRYAEKLWKKMTPAQKRRFRLEHRAK